MDTLKFYDKRAEFDSQLRDQMYALYGSYWKFLRQLPCKERSVLDDYKGSYAFFMNSILYAPDNIDILKGYIVGALDRNTSIRHLYEAVESLLREKLVKIRIFDQIFLKAPRLEKSVTVYRGLNGDVAIRLVKMKKGDVFVTKGFNSTAFDFNIALRFSNYGISGESVILRILLPKGSPYILLPGGPHQEYGETTFKKMLDDARPWYDQTELVLNRGCRMVVKNHEQHRLSPRDDRFADRYNAKTQIKIINMKLLTQDEPEPVRQVEEILKDIKSLEFRLESE